MIRKHISPLTPLVLLIAALTSFTSLAQEKEKPWTEWSEKEAQRILNHSPWAHTQIETDTSEMFFSPTTAGTSSVGRPATSRGTTGNQQSINSNRADRGATNQEIYVRYSIRFFSARPIRQALVRLTELRQHFGPDETEWLHKYAEFQPRNSIIITVTFESNDQRFSGPVLQAFNSAVTSTLKNNTYLERNDGKRLFLEEYVPPGKDGFGARFIFLRYVEEKLFITPETGEVRFHAEYPGGVKVDRRFKIANMIYNGELEY